MTDANIITTLFNDVGYNTLGDPTLIGIMILIFAIAGVMVLRLNKFPSAIMLGLLLIFLGWFGYLPTSVLAITGIVIAGYTFYGVMKLISKK
jgi:hypothetical protein